MAYTTPPTFAPGNVLDASQLNVLGDDIVYLKAQADAVIFSGAAAACGTQSIPNATTTQIIFTSETFDIGGWIAVSSPTFTVPASAIPAGFTTVVVDVRVHTDFAGSAVGARQFIANQNGSQVMADSGTADAATNTHQEGSVLTPAVVGDVFTLDVVQTSGGSLNIVGVTMSVTVYAPLS